MENPGKSLRAKGVFREFCWPENLPSKRAGAPRGIALRDWPTTPMNGLELPPSEFSSNPRDRHRWRDEGTFVLRPRHAGTATGGIDKTSFFTMSWHLDNRT